MARYVDAEKVVDVMRGAYWDENIQSAKDDPCVIDAMIDWSIRQVKDAPTEDVVPVIHADWIGVNPLADTIECSHCGYEWFTCEIATPYCPECGATMDNYKEIGEIGLPAVEVL